MEDVSMGMWVEQFNSSMAAVQYSHNWKFCQYGCMENYFTAHYQSPRQMICLWDKLARGRTHCCNFRWQWAAHKIRSLVTMSSIPPPPTLYFSPSRLVDQIMDSWMNYENQFATMTLSKCNVLYIIWSQYIHFSLTGYWIWNDVYSFFFSPRIFTIKRRWSLFISLLWMA